MKIKKICARILWCCLPTLVLAACVTHPVSADTPLVVSGSVWQYLDDGSDQGAAWREPSFNDSAWASGPAQLGYGDGDEATVVSYGPNSGNKYATTYFRHSFEVPDPSSYEGLRLRILRDDGAVVYLNGTEIKRTNMHCAAIDYLSNAVDAVGGSDEDTFYEWYAHPRNLVAGTNTIAVEIHQISGASSDISFDLELVGMTNAPVLMRKAPYLIYPGTIGTMQLVWQLFWPDTCTIEWGTDTTYSMGTDATTEFGCDHQHSYTIGGLDPSWRYFYRVSLDGEAYAGSFRSAPEENASGVAFFAYGDTRTYPADHDDIASAMVSMYASDPECQTFVLCVGDLISDGDIEYDWDTEFFDPAYDGIHTMLANLPYQSAMGNHEGTGRLFEDYFPYPFIAGRYWSFDYGPAHFAVVDQYTPYNAGSAQHTWLNNDLSSTDRPWKFVCLHEPGWSAGGHSNNVYVQNYIQPLCETHDVAILFAGHNHYYARAIKNGVQHITTGGGGAPLYDPDPGYPNVVAAERTYHFCEVEIAGPNLSFRALTPSGAVIDSFAIEHPWLGTEPSEAPSGHESDIRVSVSPNPICAGSRLSFSLSRSSPVELNIYDVGGRKVTTLLTGKLEAGKHDVEWKCKDFQGRPVGSGIYFYRLRAGQQVASGKMVFFD